MNVATTTPGFDEARSVDGTPRPGWGELVEDLARLGETGLARARAHVEHQLASDGVTYSPVLGDAPVPADGEVAAPERWQLDPVPLVLHAEEWAVLERGVAQRSTLLDAVLADLYGPQDLLRHALVPPEVVLGHEGYLRAAHGITLPGPRQLVVHAVDVARGPEGGFVALADRTQAPSGIGYALADRAVLARVLPDLLRRSAPRRLGAFADTLRTALHAVAPQAVEQPRVVVLSPGSHSETAFDQAYLAALLGLPLVEGADLTVHQGRLWMRSLGRLEQVDVVLRRVDAAFCDPLDLRSSSRLGVVGLVEACRRGTVSVVNPLGAGVLENPALVALLPALCRALLDEDLVLASVPLSWCGSPEGLSHVLANLGSVVLRPIGAGTSVVPGRLPAAEQEQWRARLGAEGWRWVGELGVELSQAPSATRGGLAQRPVVTRLFSVGQASGHVVMPGGLGGSFGAGEHPAWTERPAAAAKDVWVLSTTADQAVSHVAGPQVLPSPRAALGSVSSPRVLADLFWLGRYAERTEALTRLLAAGTARAGDVRPSGTAAAETTGVLVAAAGALSGVAVDGAEPLVVLQQLTTDAARQGTVAHSLNRLVGVAGAVRDQLSADTWAVLSSAEDAVDRLVATRAADGSELSGCHAVLLSCSLALSGLAAENMVRDPGWFLLDAGRRLERSQQLSALLRHTLGTPAGTRTAEVLLLESVLVATESVLTHRRRYSGELAPGGVLALLLLDPANPRSLVFQLQALAADLRALPGATGTSRPERLLEELVVTVRRLDADELGVVAQDGTRVGLVGVLDGVRASLRALADAVSAQHLVVSSPVAQPVEYGGMR
ncbi:circularly permuted type 2 ATP-grasp protein [Rhodococcus antarcticus]|uniref:Circularly permuted type 2 ATP-grasp protein n=1 Tax=Rhodococcus antarcticus TaxID=2987751 RepID=A0ABY6P3P1_9NOCA|nr:circularly permuted type 2 ATP-grasp protein [Rhodococcus antarcticus]UZJ26119.1 circularly permuted type 2 ATP-grasp protein [Rhodococcus antarcticus]